MEQPFEAHRSGLPPETTTQSYLFRDSGAREAIRGALLSERSTKLTHLSVELVELPAATTQYGP